MVTGNHEAVDQIILQSTHQISSRFGHSDGFDLPVHQPAECQACFLNPSLLMDSEKRLIYGFNCGFLQSSSTGDEGNIHIPAK